MESTPVKPSIEKKKNISEENMQTLPENEWVKERCKKRKKGHGKRSLKQFKSRGKGPFSQNGVGFWDRDTTCRRELDNQEKKFQTDRTLPLANGEKTGPKGRAKRKRGIF